MAVSKHLSRPGAGYARQDNGGPSPATTGTETGPVQGRRPRSVVGGASEEAIVCRAVRACVRACMCACMYACVRVRACMQSGSRAVINIPELVVPVSANVCPMSVRIPMFLTLSVQKRPNHPFVQTFPKAYTYTVF